MSDSFIIRSSLPSILTSVPDHLPNKILSPFFTSDATTWAQEKPMEGKVLAVGSGARNENGQVVALDVKKGDRILFGKWSGTEVKIDGKELLIMKESDIMGIIEK